MKYDFAMENCLGTADYPNLHELNKNCYGFSPASVQNGPQAVAAAAAAAAAADEQTMYKVNRPETILSPSIAGLLVAGVFRRKVVNVTEAAYRRFSVSLGSVVCSERNRSTPL